MPPPQSRKLVEIPIGRDHLAVVFDCERRQISVRDEIAAGLRLLAEVGEDCPVLIAWLQNRRGRSSPNLIGEDQRIF